MSLMETTGKKPQKELEANPKLPMTMMHANPKFQMGKPMLTVITLKEAGKSCVVLPNYYTNNYKKTSTHNRGIQGKELSGGLRRLSHLMV
jgi:hypothetical protein